MRVAGIRPPGRAGGPLQPRFQGNMTILLSLPQFFSLSLNSPCLSLSSPSLSSILCLSLSLNSLAFSLPQFCLFLLPLSPTLLSPSILSFSLPLLSLSLNSVLLSHLSLPQLSVFLSPSLLSLPLSTLGGCCSAGFSVNNGIILGERGKGDDAAGLFCSPGAGWRLQNLRGGDPVGLRLREDFLFQRDRLSFLAGKMGGSLPPGTQRRKWPFSQICV